MFMKRINLFRFPPLAILSILEVAAMGLWYRPKRIRKQGQYIFNNCYRRGKHWIWKECIK